MLTDKLKSLSLNSTVTVKLTPAGKEKFIKHYCRTLNARADVNSYIFADGKVDFVQLQLWELMRVFGPDILTVPFQDVKIYIDPTDLK